MNFIAKLTFSERAVIRGKIKFFFINKKAGKFTFMIGNLNGNQLFFSWIKTINEILLKKLFICLKHPSWNVTTKNESYKVLSIFYSPIYQDILKPPAIEERKQPLPCINQRNWCSCWSYSTFFFRRTLSCDLLILILFFLIFLMYLFVIKWKPS